MNKTSTGLLLALISLGSPAVVAVESVPVNVTEEMLFADDPKEWLRISRVSPPAYPKELFAKGITGHVDIDVTIDELGAVKKIGTVTSKPQNALFEASARESVKYWKFKSKLSSKCIPEIGQGNVRIWFEIRDGKEAISVSSTPGTMGKASPAAESKWRPIVNREEVTKALYYPVAAQREGEQGAVYAVMHVDSASGAVKKIEITHAIAGSMTRRSFERAATTALEIARFEPRPSEQGVIFKACMPFLFLLAN